MIQFGFKVCLVADTRPLPEQMLIYHPKTSGTYLSWYQTCVLLIHIIKCISDLCFSNGNNNWFNSIWINSLWASDAIWGNISVSTLAQVMIHWVMTSSHLDQWWLIIKGVLWHSPASNFIGSAKKWIHNMYSEITLLILQPLLPEANELIQSDRNIGSTPLSEKELLEFNELTYPTNSPDSPKIDRQDRWVCGQGLQERANMSNWVRLLFNLKPWDLFWNITF